MTDQDQERKFFPRDRLLAAIREYFKNGASTRWWHDEETGRHAQSEALLSSVLTVLESCGQCGDAIENAALVYVTCQSCEDDCGNERQLRSDLANAKDLIKRLQGSLNEAMDHVPLDWETIQKCIYDDIPPATTLSSVPKGDE